MFSSQIWMMRSNAAPSTFDVGDDGMAVSSAAWIEVRDGEMVLIDGRPLEYPGSEIEPRTKAAPNVARMHRNQFILS